MKFLRRNKRAFKYTFRISVHELIVEGTSRYQPSKLSVTLWRRKRQVSTEPKTWEPTLRNPYRGIIIWSEPAQLEFCVTLYRNSLDVFEKKDWFLTIKDHNPLKEHGAKICTCSIDLSLHVLTKPAFIEKLPMQPTNSSRQKNKLVEACISFKVECLTHEDIKKTAFKQEQHCTLVNKNSRKIGRENDSIEMIKNDTELPQHDAFTAKNISNEPPQVESLSQDKAGDDRDDVEIASKEEENKFNESNLNDDIQKLTQPQQLQQPLQPAQQPEQQPPQTPQQSEKQQPHTPQQPEQRPPQTPQHPEQQPRQTPQPKTISKIDQCDQIEDKEEMSDDVNETFVTPPVQRFTYATRSARMRKFKFYQFRRIREDSEATEKFFKTDSFSLPQTATDEILNMQNTNGFLMQGSIESGGEETLLRPREKMLRGVIPKSAMDDFERELHSLDEQLVKVEQEAELIRSQFKELAINNDHNQKPSNATNFAEQQEKQEELMGKWHELVNKKNDLVRQQMQLNIWQKEKNLEKTFEQLDKEVRSLVAMDESKKTRAQKEREKFLLDELVTLVNRRDELVKEWDQQEKAIEDDIALKESLKTRDFNSDTTDQNCSIQ